MMFTLSDATRLTSQSPPVGAFALSAETRKWKPKPAFAGRSKCRTEPKNGSKKPDRWDVQPVTQNPEMKALHERATQRPKGLMVSELFA